MIQCLQDELIKVRLAEAENDENLRDLNKKVSELEEVRTKFTKFGPYATQSLTFNSFYKWKYEFTFSRGIIKTSV